MTEHLKYLFSLLSVALLFSCHPHADEKANMGDEKTEAHTPVTGTHIYSGPVVEYIMLNATSTFRQSAITKSNINGYVKEVRVNPGDKVSRGEELFLLETKEAENLGSTINQLDTSFHFSGKVTIRANADGYITLLNHKAGDYVQDGEQLAVISDMNSFRFVLNLPYELKQFAAKNSHVNLFLPDSSQLSGTIEGYLPSVDQVSQTQQVLIRVNTNIMIPENLVATVRLIKQTKESATTLPRSAVLSNEEQSIFWIMKMIDSTTAIRIPIQKGIETGDRIEIISPKLSATDIILNSGNYGLPDTAKVMLQQEP